MAQRPDGHHSVDSSHRTCRLLKTGDLLLGKVSLHLRQRLRLK
jgi:hypothetical protein